MIGERLEVAGLAAWRRRPDDLPPERPTVVLVHGALDRAASFARTMRRLDGVDVLVYDRRGYGHSIQPGRPVGLTEDVEDLAAVVGFLARPVVVVGHSFGGLVAAWLAAHGHQRLVGIGMWETPDPRIAAVPGTPGGDALVEADAGRPDLAVETFFRRMVGDRAWDRLRPADRDQRIAEAQGLVADLRTAGHHSADPDWAAIHLPVVVGLGGLSGTGFRAAAERITGEIPGARLLDYPEAGHGVHLSRPGEFAGFVCESF